MEPDDAKAWIDLLLIEENMLDALFLSELIEKGDPAGIHIVHVQAFADAFDLVHQRSFDVVLLDLSQQDLNGMDALSRLCHFVPELPVVVLTNISSPTTATEALHLGAQDYLIKGSIDGDLLVRSLRYAIGRHRGQRDLRESQERYELAARAANDGLWDWNLRTNRIYYSPRWCLMLGYSEEEIGDSPTEWFHRLHPDDVETTRLAIARHLRRESPHFEHEYRIRHRSGSYRWMLTRGIALYTEDGEPYRMAGSQADITVRKHTEEKLIHDALHDPLTGLPNRIYFQQHLEQALHRFQRDATHQFAVLFLDLDRFKTINDSLGHLIGDRLLTSISARLESCIPPGGIIARFGGDEFAVLLAHLSAPTEAKRVAKHMLQVMEAPFSLHGHEVFTSGSIGIALSAGNYTRTEEILRDADTAMYRAKAAGTGKYRLFDASMHERAMALWQLETDLRRAVERDEFQIYYQPIVSLKTVRLAGFEALVRWNHPERGLLYPADFLALAEETGLLNLIDRWTIRHGTAQLSAWQIEYPRHPALFLNVNLSGSLLNQSDLPGYIESVLHETGIHPNTLRLEITEGTILREIVGIDQKLANLHKLNVRLCIDDFGTGYSSLSSLHRYPIHTLKIDGSFIANMSSEPGSVDIVRTIISLGHDLKMQVIAEGVETIEQLYQLQALDCEFAQGMLFAHALDLTSSTSLISQGQLWLPNLS